jgi:hypothetical protein
MGVLTLRRTICWASYGLVAKMLILPDAGLPTALPVLGPLFAHIEFTIQLGLA